MLGYRSKPRNVFSWCDIKWYGYCSFGPGAGAASGGLLAVMPRSRNMVRRVAAISGSPLAGKEGLEYNFNTKDVG